MNTLSFRNFVTGLAVAILAIDFIEELRIPLTILSVIALLTLSVEAVFRYRRSRRLAFQKVLDRYTDLQELDVSQSGVHAI